MTARPEEASTTTPREPSKALAGVAAVMPLVFGTTCCVGVALGVRSTEAVGALDPVSYALLLPFALVPVLCGVLLLLGGLTKRVPAFVTLGVATLPWLVGLAGTRLATYQVESALGFADPATRTAVTAQGVLLVSLSHLIGASLSAGTLSGVALGFALAAAGQRAPNRKAAAAALALTALPMLGVAVWLLTVWGLQGPLAPLGVAALSLPCVALAGAAVGRDAPRHRSAALAVSSVAALSLAFVAATSASATGAMVQVMDGLAAVGHGVGSVLASSARDVAVFRSVSTWAFALTAPPLLAMVVWAWTRARPTVGGFVGGGLVALLLLTAPLVDGVVVRGAEGDVAAQATTPWAGVESFEPAYVAASGMDLIVTPGALLLPDALVPTAAPARRIPLDHPTDLAAELGLVTGPNADVDAPEDLSSFAVDRRVTAETLRAVLRAAEIAGVSRVALVGSAEPALSPEERLEIERALPMLASFAQSMNGAIVHLPSAVPRPQRYSRAYHAVVGADAEAALTLSPLGDEGSEIRIDGSGAVQTASGDVYLELGEDATPSAFITAAARVAAAELRVVAALDGRPEIPDLAADQAPPATDLPPMAEAVERGIREQSEGHYLVTRELAERPDLDVFRLARLVPDIEDGNPVGMKLFGIRSNSLLDRLGIQNGDSIRSVNGAAIDGPEAALEAYAEARSSTELTITLDRDGETLTRSYQLVERLP